MNLSRAKGGASGQGVTCILGASSPPAGTGTSATLLFIQFVTGFLGSIAFHHPSIIDFLTSPDTATFALVLERYIAVASLDLTGFSAAVGQGAVSNLRECVVQVLGGLRKVKWEGAQVPKSFVTASEQFVQQSKSIVKYTYI
ncbi:hypothetical protein M427DRAFT_53775 [Gonapodya prolifera JEL478]|uniref:Uncharacterized protein n=1 Tax=Gonapodya prolifera (strain JEL478) TaxID=1344416 RepID=A0A139AP11_GONPJ|nr:hypothetical protein M427DRAFT_53775 [Gonapodya prolifera JEL478]|eukprot:KXS18384.1 hypothetical protein M427DRAFT_53775 [Gonapodya prolifera JEL478]